jgi:hypothetical protein
MILSTSERTKLALLFDALLFPADSSCRENLSMAKKVVRPVRKPWTKEDFRDLKAHSKAKTPVDKISKAMKRTVGGLRRKAQELGIGLGHRR